MKQAKANAKLSVFAENAGKKQQKATRSRPRGRPFQPGQTGNPGGRPALLPEEKTHRQSIRQAMIELGPGAIDVLGQELRSHDPEIQLKAAKIIIDKTVPDLREVTGDALNPFSDLPARLLPEIILILEQRPS